jgi:hypothetical protein
MTVGASVGSGISAVIWRTGVGIVVSSGAVREVGVTSTAGIGVTAAMAVGSTVLLPWSEVARLHILYTIMARIAVRTTPARNPINGKA